MRGRVVVWGGGDLGTGCARRLHVAGFDVVVVERARPLAVRRRAAFAAAVSEGETGVEGVRARLVERDDVGGCDCVAVVADETGDCIRELAPRVLVDARMLKRRTNLREAADCATVALGPGCVAPRDCDCVVETNRGPHLGRVILHGGAEPNTGVPADVAGRGEERVLYAGCDGTFRATVEIGALVAEGALLGRVGRQEVRAGTAGVVRGLLADGTRVRRGTKLGDVDPRGDPTLVGLVSDKANAVAGGVLEAAFRLLADGSR